MKHMSVDSLISLLISLKEDLVAYRDLWENDRHPGTCDADLLLEMRKEIWRKQADVVEAIRRKAGPAKAKYANDVFVIGSNV